MPTSRQIEPRYGQVVGPGPDVHLVQRVSAVVLALLRRCRLSVLPLLGGIAHILWFHTITHRQCRILAWPLMQAAGQGMLLMHERQRHE